MRELYDSNPEFKHYVDSYCSHRGVDTETALQHITVQHVAEYYRSKPVQIAGEPVTEQMNCKSC